jgi:Uma2 family endonuclease
MVTLDKPESITYEWPAQGDWTYEAYARLPESEWRYEVIRGELHKRPAPNVKHQQLSIGLAVAVYIFVHKNQLGRILEAPIDVILPDLASPVQPDIVYIHADNSEIIKSANIEGVPDLMVEISSPGTAPYDRHTKYRLYAEAGVKEYWIVDPDACAVDVYALRGNAYVLFGHYVGDGIIQSELLPELRIPLNDICGR